jgi:hypothetical protein
MSATATARTAPRVELGRYRVGEEDRVLVGRRIEGEVYVYDYPVGVGRPYFVEKGFGAEDGASAKAELAMLVADYRRRAAELGACPMSTEAIGGALGLTAA